MSVCHQPSRTSSGSLHFRPSIMDETKGVAEAFRDRWVFLTGVTGFLGSVLLEKLVRSCPHLAGVYVLIRKKKKFTDVQQRLETVLSLPLFCRVDKDLLRSKVVAVEGDVSLDGLGLEDVARRMVIERCHFVFHVAANINFNAALHQALSVNLAGTQRVLQLAKDMVNMKGFVYVSTAYCNCTQRDVVAEKVYPNRWEVDRLLRILAEQPPDVINGSTDRILGEHPNTYTFTKLMAENLIASERGDLPVAIVRPSIVIGTLCDPIAGWVDNVQSGAFAFIAGAGRGVFRTLPATGSRVADIVPADQLVALLLAAAWRIADTGRLQVYHFTSGGRNPVTWSEYCRLAVTKLRENPCTGLILYPRASCRSPTTVRHALYVAMAHYAPAYLLDTLAKICGDKPILLDIQYKYSKGMAHTDYFTRNEWNFSTANTEDLWSILGETDAKEFSFDVGKINWPTYIENCVLGVREYYHKQPRSTLPAARKYLKLWYLIDKASWIVVFLIFWFVLTNVMGVSYHSVISAAVLTLMYIWF